MKMGYAPKTVYCSRLCTVVCTCSRCEQAGGSLEKGYAPKAVALTITVTVNFGRQDSTFVSFRLAIGIKIPNPTADKEKDPGDTQNTLQVDSEKDPSRFTLNLSETNYQIASRQNPTSV